MLEKAKYIINVLDVGIFINDTKIPECVSFERSARIHLQGYSDTELLHGINTE
jgi:hypothetical protein